MALLGFSRSILGWFNRQRWGVFVSGRSEAGETVTFETVMRIGTAYACVRKVAEGVSCLPFTMVSVGEGGVSKPAPDHPLADLLGDMPNADQSAQQYWELVCLQLLLRGNHYALKLRTGGRLVALEPLPPHPVTSCRRTSTGAREFVVTSGARVGVYSEEDVFFVPGFGEDPDCGMSVIQAGANVFGRMISLEKHQSKLLAKGVRPNMVMTTPGALTPDQRKMAQENIINPFVGSDNAGGMMLLENGFKVEPVTMTNADAQLMEQANMGVVEICRLIGVPPWMIGHSEGSSNWGTGLEQQFRAFGMLTLRPITYRIIGEIRRQLMSRDERRKFRPVFKLEALYEGDMLTQRRVDEIDVRSGVRPVNEIRADRGLPPIEGGDVARMQAQMVPIVIDPTQGGGDAA
ncbi:phage portal protein [Hyphomonas sp.]|uniref:phage portal protein n=1 Tax=Hyphomonas sp. TaxID=87 RepID=UPI0025C50B85|nr:phage portal protein [Hyphomonas sp.]MBI1401447.1 phage portal protein [Hyphomonas sp.]